LCAQSCCSSPASKQGRPPLVCAAQVWRQCDLREGEGRCHLRLQHWILHDLHRLC
ncbi:unnamed protein product, partial [Closterium sp. Yama58-4]